MKWLCAHCKSVNAELAFQCHSCGGARMIIDLSFKELKELMEKAKAATPGPWYGSIGSDDEGEFSTVGPAYLGDSLQNILNNAVCYLKPDNIQSNCNNIYIAAANPKVVLDLCERVIGLGKALQNSIGLKCECISPCTSPIGLVVEGFVCGRCTEARYYLERFGVKNDT